MRFTVERDLLHEAVSRAARVLPAHPERAGLRLQASSAAGLQVSACDDQVSAQDNISAEVAEEGTAVVARRFTEIARSLPAGAAEISADETRMTLRSRAAAFTLRLMPAAECPALPGMPPLAGTIGSAALATAVRQAATAAARDASLPALTGIRAEISGEHLTLICTDRYRVAISDLTWVPARADLETAVLIPARTLTGITRAGTTTAETAVHLDAARRPFTGPGIAGFAAGPRRVTARLLDEEFPDVRRQIPAQFSCTAEISVAPFIDALKRAALAAAPNTPVRLAFAGGQVTLEAGAGDEARATEELDVKFNGDGDFRISFNPGYLADGLAATGSDTARIAFTTPARPAVITGAGDPPGFRYVLMPVRGTG